MKHIFIDTNNFLSCAFMYEKGQDPSTIAKYENLLMRDRATLILPEIVEIEFFRKIDSTLMLIKEKVEDFKKIIKKDFPDYLKLAKEDFMELTQKLYSDRVSSSTFAKEKIPPLFENRNVKRIPLTSEIIVSAYKRALAGKKPYKYRPCPECGELNNLVDNDCIIFESILSKIKELGNVELIFCSANTKDFAEFNEKTKAHELHPELLKEMPKEISIKYYRSMGEALKSEFKTSINKTEMTNINDILNILSAPQIEFSKILRSQMPSFEGWASQFAKTLEYRNILSPISESVRKLSEDQSNLSKQSEQY